MDVEIPPLQAYHWREDVVRRIDQPLRRLPGFCHIPLRELRVCMNFGASIWMAIVLSIV